jgi:hypothetical protein
MKLVLVNFISGFNDLFRESIITQSVVTTLITLTVCYMYISGQKVPTELVNVLMLVLGFYFGGKSVLAKTVRSK